MAQPIQPLNPQTYKRKGPFSYCSAYVRRWWDIVPDLHEVPVTEWLLMGLNEANAKNVDFRVLSSGPQGEELITGADLEVHVLWDSYDQCFLVQAKRYHNGKFKHLNYKQGGQMAKLLQACSHGRAMPLYFFYSSAYPRFTGRYFHPGRGPGQISKRILGSNGCYFAFATQVDAWLRAGGKKNLSVLETALPFSCLDWVIPYRGMAQNQMVAAQKFFTPVAPTWSNAKGRWPGLYTRQEFQTYIGELHPEQPDKGRYDRMKKHRHQYVNDAPTAESSDQAPLTPCAPMILAINLSEEPLAWPRDEEIPESN